MNKSEFELWTETLPFFQPYPRFLRSLIEQMRVLIAEHASECHKATVDCGACKAHAILDALYAPASPEVERPYRFDAKGRA